MLQTFTRVEKLMGNRFEITVVRGKGEEVLAQADLNAAVAEISRIEQLFTTYKETSVTNKINQQAGIAPVCVDEEVFGLIYRSLKISALTMGAFDITYGSIDKRFWNFDKTMDALPSKEELAKMVRLINYRNVELDEKKQTVYLKEKGMRIGFGGIGKGYAADKARQLLQSRGVKSGIVNASGDLTVWGSQPNGKPWTIGIANPNAATEAFSYMEITNTSIATSGNYEKFVSINGRKYSHTIDPRTGYPAQGIKSVTIFCPVAEIADAMATPVMVMGIGPGINMINQMKNMACIVIDENDKIYTSKNINLRA